MKNYVKGGVAANETNAQIGKKSRVKDFFDGKSRVTAKSSGQNS